MARPDGRAFLRPLGAEPPRGGALRGASALAPGLGLVAASVWARPCGRASGPGLGPALPARRPRGLVLLAARQGERGLPSAPSGRVPPAPCGLRAATPARPGRLGRRPPRPPAAVGVMWRLVAACGGSGLRPCGACQPPAVARGYPSAKQGQAPSGARLRRGLALLLPRAGRGVGAPARPGPHSVGAVGPSAPPARSGLAPASRPALARLRLCLRWCGSASARPSRRSGPAPLRRPAAEPRGGVRAPAGRGPCAAAIFTPRARALPALRVAALSRASRAAGARGHAACGRDGHTGAHPARPRQAACGGPCLMISGAAKGDKVTRPPVAGHQPPHIPPKKGHKKNDDVYSSPQHPSRS
jgi:hypothetical protein